MRSHFNGRRVPLGLAFSAILGLTACAEPGTGTPGASRDGWGNFVAAMKQANETTRVAQKDVSNLPRRPDGETEAEASPAAAAETALAKTETKKPAEARDAAATAAATRPTAPAPTPAPAVASTSDTVSAPAAKAVAALPPRPANPDLASIQRQLSELESKVAALTAENQRQMERLTQVTNGAIADMEQLFSALRLELRSAGNGGEGAQPRRKRIPGSPTAQRSTDAQGGPFLPWPPIQTAERTTGEAVEPLMPDLKTFFLLHQIVNALPLTAPLEEALVTGGYGQRRDPFNRRAAFHDGIDLQAPMRSPVHVTAAGIVTVAGMRPAYGRVVEVDHGFGITTRYAHLASISVKEGDRLDRHALVGLLGNSGRARSPHLHYEVLFNGLPKDPADLLVLAEGIRSLR